ncbi:MAG: hypothetical protein LBJ73_01925 [Rickettsiales bacterium]|jgi:hypothetical protein|nr:hypothetical protein [Rickettsiales bacterium]
MSNTYNYKVKLDIIVNGNPFTAHCSGTTRLNDDGTAILNLNPAGQVNHGISIMVQGAVEMEKAPEFRHIEFLRVEPKAPSPETNGNRIDGKTVYFNGKPSDAFLSDFRKMLNKEIRYGKVSKDSDLLNFVFDDDTPRKEAKKENINVVVTYNESEQDFASLKKIKHIFDTAKRSGVIIETIIAGNVGNIGGIVAAMGTPNFRKMYSTARHKVMYYPMPTDRGFKTSMDINRNRAVENGYSMNSKITPASLNEMAQAGALYKNAAECLMLGLCDTVIDRNK